jgi:long-chain acyl-CoA synthetase
LIKVGNVTWFPRDVEDALCKLACVLQASVIGLPDEALGTRPIGCITVAPGTEIDEAALRGPLQAKLSQYDLSPLTIKVVAEFPMTPTGKISKAQLAEQLSAARA